MSKKGTAVNLKHIMKKQNKAYKNENQGLKFYQMHNNGMNKYRDIRFHQKQTKQSKKYS